MTFPTITTNRSHLAFVQESRLSYLRARARPRGLTASVRFGSSLLEKHRLEAREPTRTVTPTHQLLRQMKAKSLSVKIPANEPTTARLNCVLANGEFLTVEIPRYVLERFMARAKRAIEGAPLLSRKRSNV